MSVSMIASVSVSVSAASQPYPELKIHLMTAAMTEKKPRA